MKLPDDAFEYYVSLGGARSYRVVAEKYGVSKRAVTNRATRDHWQDRLREIMRRAQKKAEAALGETLAEMFERHLRLLQVIQGKALESLKSMPLTSAWDAVKALDMVMDREAKIRAGNGPQG